MVSKEYIEQSALDVYRKKGSRIARAFLEALGVGIIPAPIAAPAVFKPEGVFSDKYEGLDWCFANGDSVMDRPI